MPVSSLHCHVATGRLGLTGAVSSLSVEHAICEGGTKHAVDALLCATGYSPGLGPLGPLGLDLTERYLHVWPLDGDSQHAARAESPSLACVGLCRVAGPTLPVAEMQVRWVGLYVMPPGPDM